MAGLTDITRSTVGKKLLNGLTGLLLCGFIVSHLTGNLLLLVGREAFNQYAYFLHSLGHGAVVPIMEVGLVMLFGAHAISGISVARSRRRARPDGYKKSANAGGTSRKSLASRSMIVTGTVLLIFVILHVAQFKLGWGQLRDYPDVMIDGHASVDLYSRVVDWFNWAPMVGLYVVVMLMLGNHLRHGFWSAFQTLGANNPRYENLINTAGMLFAAAMAVGFLLIPIYIFLFVEPTAGSSLAAG
ncbi:MAG: succinate dehydrogenase [Acidobacteria bacterium]|nr:succinate dehydrogenase [Acidobacteriota bacterium]